MKNNIDAWERAIDKALKTGKGRYAYNFMVSDLFEYKKIIKLIRAKKYTSAFNEVDYLDTNNRDQVPNTIYKFLMEHGDTNGKN